MPYNTKAEKRVNFNGMTMAWDMRPDAWLAYAHYDNPRYAAAMVVVHGNFGAQTAAPAALDMVIYALLNAPAGRNQPQPTATASHAASI
jgi:penicillin-binding protein 2